MALSAGRSRGRPGGCGHRMLHYTAFHVGDEQTLLGPGGLLLVPPNTMHWGEVVGDKPVLNLDVFTPQRPEYA